MKEERNKNCSLDESDKLIDSPQLHIYQEVSIFKSKKEE